MGSYIDELVNKYSTKEKEEKKQTASSPAKNSSSSGVKNTSQSSNVETRSSSYIDKLTSKYVRSGNTDDVTDDFVSTFMADVESYFGRAKTDIDGIGYKNADSTYRSHYKDIDDLLTRSRSIEKYLRDNRSAYEDEAYNSVRAQLSEINKALAQYSSAFYEARHKFSQFSSEEEYNTAMRQYDWQRKYESRSKEDLNTILVNIKDGEEKDWLSSYVDYIEYEEQSNFDIDAAQKEIDALKQKRDEIARSKQSAGSNYLTGGSALDSSPYAAGHQKSGVDPELADLLTQIRQKQQYLNQAKRIQHGATLSGVADRNSDNYDQYFNSFSQYKTTVDPNPEWWQTGVGDNQYEWINNQNGFRDEYESSLEDLNSEVGASSQSGFYTGPKESEYKQKGYDQLTSSEIAIYNYYYAKEGKEKAQEYLDSIQESLNYRKATAMFADMEDKTFQEMVFGVEAGLDQFSSGISALLNTEDDYIPQSAVQMASAMVREDLGDDGAKLPDLMGGASLGQVGYDAITTSANMAPSILTSMAVGMLNPIAGKITGNVLMGASAAGNAYQEALNEGYDKNQARGYGLLVGASEMVMEKVIGGISAVGGNALGKVFTKNLSNADSALKMIAKKLGGSALSEFGEEYLQEVLTPVFQNIALRKDEEVKLLSAEALYSGILGALTAGMMEGPTTIWGEAKTYDTGNQLKQAGISATRLAEIGSTFAADTVAYQLAGKVNENTGAYTMGRLFNEIGATLTEQNVNDITDALVKEGISSDIAKEKAKQMAMIVEGATLTDKFIEALDDDKILAKAVRTTIIDSNTTWFQRTKGYNEALMALAQEKASRTEEALPGQENAPASDKVDTQNESGAESVLEPTVETETFQKSTGEAVTVKEVASIKDGRVTLRLDNDQTVAADDVSFSNEGEALLYDVVAQMGASPKAANILVNGFNSLRADPVAATAYAQGIKQAFRYGELGIPVRELANTDFASKLTAAQQDYAYRQGKKVAGRQVAVAQATVKKTLDAAKAIEKAVDSGKNSRGIYHAVLEDGITPLSLNESQKASYELADQIAQAANVNIVVYVGKTGEQGYYHPGTDKVYLNLNATNKSRKSMMAFTLGHELVHRAKVGSPAKYEAFTAFLMKEYSKRGASVEAMIAEEMAAAKEHGIEITEEKAFEEVVADACQRMLLDTDAGQKLAEFGKRNKQNKSFLEDLKRWITEFMDRLRSIFKDVDPASLAAQEFEKFDQNVKQILADMYVDMTIDAGENLSAIQNAFGKGTKVEANSHGEFTVASSPDGSEKVFNLVTWKNGGRETLEATLLREGYTEEDVKAALTIMDGKQELVEKIANELDDNGAMAFPEQGRINEATLTTDLKDGHSVLSALVSNGDYPVNIDLLMVCKKRKAYQRVINRLCETGLIQQATVDALAIAEINKILGKYGFETACLGCFVESRRLRIQEWAQTIVKEWNSEVKKRNPNAKSFGFGKGEATLTPDEVMQLIGELESGGEKNDKGNLNLGQGSAVKRMGVLLDKVPSLRKTLTVEDLITPDGLTALRQFDSNLFSMVKSRYGSNSPKFVQEFNPYNHELAMYGKVPQQYNSLREYLYAIGGARMQSFSDFIVENWFDYCQIVADLASRKLPMHTYTKEIALAKLFGMTGIKINMSLIPDVDRSLGKEYAGLTRNAKGELELIWADKDRFKATGGKSYMQSINFADAIALQNDPRYSANVGTIAVGISDKHIRMMLNDSRIRMVIPYHSSGMNPIFADMMGTSYYKDYTNVQNTTVKQIYNSKGQPVTLKLTKPQVSQLTGGFQFNEALQETGDARAAAEAYKDWCADSSKHTITIKGETYTAELTPKFNDFRDETNYYKLLEDFNPYDCITEEAAPQGDVQQIYPEGFEDILRAELSSQERHRRKQEKNQAFDKAMGEIESFLKTHTKADTVHYANQHGIKLGAKDKKLGADDKAKLKRLQEQGASFSLPKADAQSYQEPAYQEWDVQAALYDALDHADKGNDNMIKVGQMPRYITEKIGIEGDFYIYRNHAYENMVSEEKAIEEGRPIFRKGEKIHFHDLGVDTMTEAIMSLEKPTMTIATKTADGNPAVIMILPVNGKNKAPLYSVLSFYSDRKINGDYSRKPHVVLTIAERDFFGSKGRSGYAEIVGRAVHDGRVIDFNKEMRDDLSVIANPAGVGNITDSSLTDNLARFRKEIKAFREKNHIDYSLSVGEDTSPRALLSNAFETIITNPIEKRKLDEYKGKTEMLNAEEKKLRELRKQIKELSFGKGKRDTKRIKELQFEAVQTENRIATLDKTLLRFEASAPLQNILQREKEMVRKREREKTKAAIEEYRSEVIKTQHQMMDWYQQDRKEAVAKARETAGKRDAKAKLQKLVLDTAKWISSPAKTDVKCPDILKQPYADFLNSIDMSSARLAKGGDPTKNDLRLANAMGSLATALERIMASQDPTQETASVLDAGYLDLPPHFVQKLRDMTENVKAMMVEGDYVVNTMTAEEVRKLSQMIRTLNHAIKEVSTLYANLRFANVEALGDESMTFMDDLGEIQKTGGMKDFVQWENALPFYAFKRFGKGGESIFEGLMDAQDKLAFLAQKIFNFQEKAWKGDEAKKWSEDTHTIDLPDGEKLTLTTADAMSIYCLSRRQQGLQHLLGGGVRVIGIQKGSQKAKDSRSTLTIKDIDAIISSLTDRQKRVAEAIQEFMSTTCSEWGNEISMKRFLTKEFNEKFYFPIESNDENLPTKDPSAQQSDLFRLLNISATKPVDPRANNEVIVRNIFDVFTGHASDMARLNAFGMPLLDYMKWLNYREKTVNDEGQINVRGVRKSMETAFGNAAKSYVLNLIKDVNGRFSDGGDPSILMKWMRTAKTASVGSSLRVATLQITSYPRAALVLSPKSLSLGLTKKPNIARAKKYCGIALWKSFGFYDTNISRSIEEQMKGVKDVRQKLIELSLQGAEWGDALTWGALWNACEYEVASTKKYKVGSEEFYQAVGNKLREVVYATQVVDSMLTRSQIMRSKRGMAQEAAAFMSEPTLSANILMDAGLAFNMEKRRTGNAKAAWKNTGKYIGRAVAVYSIGQLTAALLEGLWDAWRDDEDEEFGEKYLGAFAENLALDLVPFNKIPIVSDIFEAALAMFGVGFYSSDKMSTTWLTQAVSAADAWKKALDENSSATVYNALYNTVRAVSSFYGVSFSGVMREGVALWNNTAGAQDTTLKIRKYELTTEQLGNELYEAITSGNKDQADSIRNKFREKAENDKEYKSSVNSAVRKALRENDPRIHEAAKAWNANDLDEYMRIAKEIIAEKHFGQDDVVMAIRAEANELAPDDGKASTDKAKGLFTAEKFAEAIVQGDQAMANAIKSDIIKTAQKNGKTVEEAEKSFNSTAKGDLKELYLDSKISDSKAINALVKYCGMDQEDAEEDISDWAFENQYGFAYADRKDAYQNGMVSAEELVKILEDRGYAHEDAAAQVTAYEWEAEGIDGATADAIQDYIEWCEPVGISKSTYMAFRKFDNATENDVDENGKKIAYSAVQKIMAYINGLNLTSEQKNALAKSTGWSDKTINKYKLW